MPRATEPPGEAPGTPAEPSAPAPATLFDLDARLPQDGPADPAAAIAAFGDPVTPAPVPPAKAERRGGFRPTAGRKAKTATEPVSHTHQGKSYKTKPEVEAENAALRARLAIQESRPLSEESLRLAKQTVEGIVKGLNIVARATETPEMVYTPTESNDIGDAFKEPAAPLLERFGKAAPWYAACGSLFLITLPKLMAWWERAEREAKEAKPGKGPPRLGMEGKTEIVVPSVPSAEPLVQRPPSDATLSGGILP